MSLQQQGLQSGSSTDAGPSSVPVSLLSTPSSTTSPTKGSSKPKVNWKNGPPSCKECVRLKLKVSKHTDNTASAAILTAVLAIMAMHELRTTGLRKDLSNGDTCRPVSTITGTVLVERAGLQLFLFLLSWSLKISRADPTAHRKTQRNWLHCRKRMRSSERGWRSWMDTLGRRGKARTWKVEVSVRYVIISLLSVRCCVKNVITRASTAVSISTNATSEADRMRITSRSRRSHRRRPQTSGISILISATTITSIRPTAQASGSWKCLAKAQNTSAAGLDHFLCVKTARYVF